MEKRRFVILKARKKPVRNQEEILKDLLVIFDRGVKGIYGNTLTTYASKFRNCDPGLDTEYIKFGDEVVLAAFNDRLKNEYEAVLEEIKAFVTRSLDVETNGKWKSFCHKVFGCRNKWKMAGESHSRNDRGRCRN